MTLTESPDPRSDSEIESEAARWIVRMEGEPTPEERADFSAWRLENERHETACQRLETVWTRAGLLKYMRPAGHDIDADLLKPPHAPAQQSSKREYPVLRWISAALIPITAVGVVVWISVLPVLGMSYDTDATRSGHYQLEDGSHLDLRPSSHVRVRMTETARVVEFDRGEVRFTVQSDPTHRPFEVRIGTTVLRAKGTDFWVRSRDPARFEMEVVEGRVLVETAGRDPPTLTAGERITVAAEKSRIDPSPERRVALRRTRLADAVREFNLYYDQPMRIADASLEEVTLSGSFRAVNREGFLETLADREILSEDRGNEIVLFR